MIHSSVGYCPCGAEIWIEYLPPGNRQLREQSTDHGWQVRFFDGENRLIEACPECKRQIKEADLASR